MLLDEIEGIVGQSSFRGVEYCLGDVAAGVPATAALQVEADDL
jgi:hypothetical protein